MEAPSEKVQAKAVAYLSAGQVKVESVMRAHGSLVAHFYVTPSDGGDPYVVKYMQGAGWACDCPARVSPCAHIWASSLIITVPDESSKPTLGFSKNTSLDEFLGISNDSSCPYCGGIDSRHAEDCDALP